MTGQRCGAKRNAVILRNRIRERDFWCGMNRPDAKERRHSCRRLRLRRRRTNIWPGGGVPCAHRESLALRALGDGDRNVAAPCALLESESLCKCGRFIGSGAEALRSAVEACPEPVEWGPLTPGGGGGGGWWEGEKLEVLRLRSRPPAPAGNSAQDDGRWGRAACCLTRLSLSFPKSAQRFGNGSGRGETPFRWPPGEHGDGVRGRREPVRRRSLAGMSVPKALRKLWERDGI